MEFYLIKAGTSKDSISYFSINRVGKKLSLNFLDEDKGFSGLKNYFIFFFEFPIFSKSVSEINLLFTHLSFNLSKF